MKAAQSNLFSQSVCWCQNVVDGVQLRVYMQPNAKTTEAAGEFNGALKIRLNAPNHAVHLETGHSSRYKQIRVTAAAWMRRLCAPHCREAHRLSILWMQHWPKDRVQQRCPIQTGFILFLRIFLPF